MALPPGAATPTMPGMTTSVLAMPGSVTPRMPGMAPPMMSAPQLPLNFQAQSMSVPVGMPSYAPTYAPLGQASYSALPTAPYTGPMSMNAMPPMTYQMQG